MNFWSRTSSKTSYIYILKDINAIAHNIVLCRCMVPFGGQKKSEPHSG